ncbi:MAG: hypothetical protein IT430_01105 [Phycisphaerales bacterium]|nr:hypothetical protein [Phycisphaerales bacterium]
MRITVDERWRVCARMRVECDVPLETAQRLLNDFRAFLIADPLHQRITFDNGEPDDPGEIRGEAITIRHALLGVHIDRAGRILRWRPGFELAVSDLSQRGRSVGFPHMCRYVLSERRPRGHSLLYEVRGVWTARWVPRWVVRLWLGWVMQATRGRLLAHLAKHA